jgi:hypothetical protein
MGEHNEGQLYNYNTSHGTRIYAAHAVIMTLTFYFYLLMFCTMAIVKMFINRRVNNLL